MEFFYLIHELLRSIVSDAVTRERFQELKILPQKQKYPEDFVIAGINKTRVSTLEEARIVKDKHDEELITYVSIFNPTGKCLDKLGTV